VLAHAEITIDECFIVREIRIVSTKDGHHVEMPKVREKGRYREVAYALDAPTRKMIEQAVLAEYEKRVRS
jgi:stage V sporulation protein G